MKLKLIPLFLLLSFLALTKPTLAATTCEIASFDQSTRNLTVCIGGFDEIDHINNTLADFHCLGNSNFPDVIGGQGSCRDVQQNRHTMVGYTNCIGDPNCNVAIDPNGKYYTCLTGQGMSRAIGKIEVRFSKGGNNICTTNSVYTRPADWNPLTEGLALVHDKPISGGPECTTGDGQKGINTALGCIPTDFTGGGFVTALLRLAIGIGSGIALLLILYGIFIVTTSAGIPDKLNAGRDIITSAIAGLIFIILSIFLLNFIGVKILAIPGL
ncbi:hypothetical protein HYS10_00150 [Candidatus Collierbacteria bacterium]|nr:hypothetical protein [Candidatus Collierbacteria bacterium]